MFGKSYFGNRYFGGGYWGRSSAVQPQVVASPGGIDARDLPFVYTQHPRQQVVYLRSVAFVDIRASSQISIVTALHSAADPVDIGVRSTFARTQSAHSNARAGIAVVGRISIRSAPSTASLRMAASGEVQTIRQPVSTAGLRMAASSTISVRSAPSLASVRAFATGVPTLVRSIHSRAAIGLVASSTGSVALESRSLATMLARPSAVVAVGSTASRAALLTMRAASQTECSTCINRVAEMDRRDLDLIALLAA